MEKDNIKSLKQLFDGFDYQKYWQDWEKEHQGESKEITFGPNVGKEKIWN